MLVPVQMVLLPLLLDLLVLFVMLLVSIVLLALQDTHFLRLLLPVDHKHVLKTVPVVQVADQILVLLLLK